MIDDLDRAARAAGARTAATRPRDERARLLMSIPGVAEAARAHDRLEIGDIARFPSARKLVGYPGLTPRIKQSGQSSASAGSPRPDTDTLRWAAVEASQQAWRPTTPGTASTATSRRRHGKPNPAKAAVARKVLIASWHILSLGEPFKPSAPARAPRLAPASSSIRLAAEAHKRSEKPGQLQPDHVRRPSRAFESWAPAGLRATMEPTAGPELDGDEALKAGLGSERARRPIPRTGRARPPRRARRSRGGDQPPGHLPSAASPAARAPAPAG